MEPDGTAGGSLYLPNQDENSFGGGLLKFEIDDSEMQLQKILPLACFQTTLGGGYPSTEQFRTSDLP